ncbi:MAG: T9SS type A sorting domain-containing protein [Bacteroidota bacterium]
MRHNTLVLFLLLVTTPLLAQLVEVAPPQNLQLKTVKAEKARQPFLTKTDKNLSLPFFDDFSNNQPFPDVEKWQEPYVYVNPGLGLNPPSIGVASFDGLDAQGIPYGTTYGGSDTLTSQSIELGSFTASDNIYLSFYVQAKGFGDKPEENDSLVLEFLNNVGSWVTIEQFPGLTGVPNTFIPDFSFHIYPVTNAAYLHDNFQFRFRNYSNRTGFIDVWNIDYVYLDRNRSLNDQSLTDLAFVYPPISQLTTYSAMPIKQFNEDRPGEIALEARMAISNNSGGTASVNQRALQTIVDGGPEFINKSGLTGGGIPAFSIEEYTDQISLGDYLFGQVPFANFTRVELTTFYQLTPAGGVNQPAFVLGNDVVEVMTVLDDYYAYDDGTAESSIVAQGQGTQIAVQYQVNEIDTLQGIRLHIPHIDENAESQLFNLKVWLDDLNSAPVAELNFASPIYVDSINGFTTFTFGDDFVELQSDQTFYVGWQQFTPTADAIPVGFDRNNEAAGVFNFFNTGSGWQSFPSSIQGALMIRPVLGEEPLSPTVSVNELVDLRSIVQLYPNPVNQRLNVLLPAGNYSGYDYQLFNAQGQLMRAGQLQPQIDLSGMADGMYFIQLRDQNGSLSTAERILKVQP